DRPLKQQPAAIAATVAVPHPSPKNPSAAISARAAADAAQSERQGSRLSARSMPAEDPTRSGMAMMEAGTRTPAQMQRARADRGGYGRAWRESRPRCADPENHNKLQDLCRVRVFA